jgi:hypothetical protein
MVEMEFKSYNFDCLNETDIREEIVSPLLRLLDYRSGTENNIIREQYLSYPHMFHCQLREMWKAAPRWA